VQDDAKMSIQEKIAARNAANANTSSGDTLMTEDTPLVQTGTGEQDASGSIDLNSAGAPEDGQFVKSILQETQENPKTGAETWIILLATLIITGFYFYSKRKAV